MPADLSPGTRVWNRYDMEWGVIEDYPPYTDINGNVWYDVRQDNGRRKQLDYPQRMVPESDHRAGT